jgi:hypothetical protein
LEVILKLDEKSIKKYCSTNKLVNNTCKYYENVISKKILRDKTNFSDVKLLELKRELGYDSFVLMLKNYHVWDPIKNLVKNLFLGNSKGWEKGWAVVTDGWVEGENIDKEDGYHLLGKTVDSYIDEYDEGNYPKKAVDSSIDGSWSFWSSPLVRKDIFRYYDWGHGVDRPFF